MSLCLEKKSRRDCAHSMRVRRQPEDAPFRSGLIEECVREADWSSARCWWPGQARSRLISRDLVKSCAPGSVIVDMPSTRAAAPNLAPPPPQPADLYRGRRGALLRRHLPAPRLTRHRSASPTPPALRAGPRQQRAWRAPCWKTAGLKSGLNLCGGRITHASLARIWVTRLFAQNRRWRDVN